MKYLIICSVWALGIFSCQKENYTNQNVDSSNQSVYKDGGEKPWTIRGVFEFKLLRPAPTNKKGETCACKACFGLCGEGAVTVESPDVLSKYSKNSEDDNILSIVDFYDSYLVLTILEPINHKENVITIDPSSKIPNIYGLGVELIPGEYIFNHDINTIHHNGEVLNSYGSVVINISKLNY